MMHFFDGFRTSHEYQKIEVWDCDDLKEMVDCDAVKAFGEPVSLNRNHPHLMGSAEQPETFFQHREASNPAYLETPDLVAKYMDKVNAKIGTDYKPFNDDGAEDATEIIVAMGSVCDAAEELIDYLTAQGRKVGMIEVHLYLSVLPEVSAERNAEDCEEDRCSEPYPKSPEVSASLFTWISLLHCTAQSLRTARS